MAAGDRTVILGNLSKASAERWAKQRGNRHQGGKARHYEVEPDEDNPGMYQIVFVEDE